MDRPVLRYFGGKFRLAPWVLSNFPEHRVYVEPFGGAASVLMQKKRSYGEIYNDLDGGVVNVFRMLQQQSLKLEQLLRVTPYAREEFELSMEPTDDPLERARRTIILSFMGFGADSVSRTHRTGFRSNSNSSGTSPARDWVTYADCIRVFAERLKGVVIENRDALEVMESQDSEETLHYCDPPYMHDTRTGSGSYRFEMNDEHHTDLLEYLCNLKGYVVLSGYDHEAYRRLEHRGWLAISQGTNVFGNRPRTEILWLNPKAADDANQMRFKLDVIR